MGAPKKKVAKVREPKAATFRCNAHKVGLTYSCPKDMDEHPFEDNEWLLEKLEELNGHCQYIIARERHKSGKNHFHAWIKYDVKVETKNERYFDILGVHPNVLFKPGPGWQHYCKKDKDFITNLEVNPFTVALACGTVEEAMNSLWVSRPQLMAVNADRIEKNFRKKMKAKPAHEVFYGPWPWPKLENFTTVTIVGPSNIGKTQFAKTHFDNPLMVRHIDRLKDFNPQIHDGIIFDDMSFAHTPRETQIHITDWDEDSDIHIRYGTVEIPKHTQKIFTANYNPFQEDEAILRRMEYIELRPPGYIEVEKNLDNFMV